MPQQSYEIGVVFTGTGTADTGAASAAIVGTASDFGNEFAVGYLVTIGGETRVILSVTDATHMTATADFTVGTGAAEAYTGVSLVNLESLGTLVYPPKSTFTESSQELRLGNGLVRGAGWQVATWRWGFMSQAQRDQLRTFCTASSAAVYIRSRKNDNSNAYTYYSGTVIWPTGQEEQEHFKRLAFSLRFQNLVTIAVS